MNMYNNKEVVVNSSKEITMESIVNFFDNIMDKISKDKTAFICGNADEKTTKHYEPYFQNNADKVMENTYTNIVTNNMRSLVTDYFTSVSNSIPEKLALCINGSDVYVFAVVKDIDDEIATKLILLDDSIQSKYYSKGLKVHTDIIQSSQFKKFPEGYKEFSFGKAA